AKATRASLLGLGLMAALLHETPELPDSNLVDSQQIRPSDVDTMLRVLVLAPLSLPFGEQSHDLIDLLLGRPHQERPGLDADQRHAEGVGSLFPRLVRSSALKEG